MSGYYAIFECSNTLSLCVKAKQEGFPAWIPIQMVKRKDRWIRHAALPGYIFVAWERWKEFYRWAQERYGVRLMVLPDQCGISTPVRVTDSQLYDMDKILRQLYRDALNPRPEAPTMAAEFKPGQLVEVKAGPFEGLTGIVSRYRNDKVRVQFGNKYVVMPPAFMVTLR